ncbi:MAG: GNAT family N-acetyltransferase [Prevotellaceae bacterium]|jgi:predicted GNAT family N-acyltransferase|nr:GNAT family N-acetyltransferase [Prevotellaceae bacterium]
MKNRKEQTKKLWINSFDDAPEFVDFFFDKIYSEQYNITIEVDNQIVSALQVIPFVLKTGAKILPVAYLYGICTDKNFRNQGMMKQLMNKTHKLLMDRDYAATILIPAEEYLFDIYGKSGYKTVFYKSYIELKSNNFSQNTEIKMVELPQHLQAEAFVFLKSQYLKKETTVLPVEDYFHWLCDSFYLDKKKIFIALQKKKIVGMMFLSENNVVLELLAQSNQIELSMVEFVLQLYDTKSLTCKKAEKKTPYGMIKILKTTAINDNFFDSQNPHLNLMLDE